MTRRIAFVNEKGGSCKTTLTVNVGAYLAIFRRRRVLIVDLDSQGQVGKSLGLDVRGAEKTALELLCEPSLPPTETIQPSRIRGLDVVVANKRLADFTLRVANDGDREEKLARSTRTLEDGYDFVLYDSPPSLGLITRNIFLAAHEIVVPVNLTYLALDGCAEIVDSISRVREQTGREEPHLSLVVPTLYRNTRLAKEILAKLRHYFPEKLSRHILGFSVKIDEAQSHGQTIWEYAPTSRGAEMIEGIAREVERPRR